MASNINSNNIDGTYPIAGQDNDSQGFRTNFTNIKNNFTYAKSELEDLQSKVVLKSALSGGTLDNNMAGAVFKGAEIRDLRETRSDLGTTSGTVSLNHANAHYYTLVASGNVTLSFTGFPSAGKLGRIRLEITVNNTAYTMALPASVTLGIQGIAGLDSSNVITFNEAGTFIFEFTTEDGGTTIHINDLTRPRYYFYGSEIQLEQRTPTSTGQDGDKAGMIALNNANIYLCTADYDGSTVIWKNTSIATTANTVVDAAQPNITSVGATLTSSGNITGGNLLTAGSVTASTLVSNVATGTAPLTVSSTTQVANLNVAVAGTVATAAQPNITSVGTLTSLTTAAGTTSVAPLNFTSGTLLSSAAAGKLEWDGTTFFLTRNTTAGRSVLDVYNSFRLSADGSVIGPTIADYFANGIVTMDAASAYEFEWHLYFLKSTAGTVTFTLTFSQAPVNVVANYIGSPVGGVSAVGTPQVAGIVASTSTATALPVTGSLSDATNHAYVIRATVESNASTGGTVKLLSLIHISTVTPKRGSWFRYRRYPSANAGAFT